MHEGDLSARADLRDFQNDEHLFALGALEELKGEILIMDGEPYISLVEDGEPRMVSSYDFNATLLVYTSVEHWTSIQIPVEIETYRDLEIFVAVAARDHGIDTDEPFPMVIAGVAKSIDWHIIDWPEGDTQHSHEKHMTIGPHGTFTEREVEILGFYSDSHHGIFTHHSTNMHLHFRTADNMLAGHLDDIEPGRQMMLFLPGTE